MLEHIYNKKRSGNDKGVSLAMYVDERPNATWHADDGRGVWQLPCDIALPCARENTLHLEDAKALVANGCKVVGEGANMPTTLEATEYFQAERRGVHAGQGCKRRRRGWFPALR